MKYDNKRYFYLKDHLGTVRAVIDTANNVVSAQDVDCWGYLMQNRTYQSDNAKYKFTSKERDVESNYDYFGARYYDARIANWGSVDPLMEKHKDWTPYNYVLRNPIRLLDPNGKQVDFLKAIFNFESDYRIGEAEGDIYNNTTTEERARYYGMTIEEYSSGRIEQTLDEMLFGVPELRLGVITEETVAKSIEFSISKHAGEQMLKRGITPKMIEKGLEKGTIYSGHKGGALTYILKDAFASGKSLLVGQNPVTKVVTTTYKGNFKKLSKKLTEISEEQLIKMSSHGF